MLMNKTEEEIMQNWNLNFTEPLVTISTITFNHVKYIETALDSFLSQETTFPFEILIHDDASTDGTSEIVRKYAEKFPNIIKPIIQTENQWSKGVRNITCTYNMSRALGKYIALCECDDYWCDNKKLQKCCDFLENNKDYSTVVHQTNVIDSEGNFQRAVCKYKGDTDIITLNSYLEFPHTSSYFFRNPLKTDNQDAREKFNLVSGWDKSFVLFFIATGKVKYFSQPMSCYRYVNNTGDSWTASMGRTNRTKMIIEAETAQLNQIKNYNLKINMAPHYYRNVMFYSLKFWLKQPSKENWNLFLLGFKSCPRKVFFFTWLLRKSFAVGVHKAKKLFMNNNTKHNTSGGGCNVRYFIAPTHFVKLAA
mgnify:CR=1 FL=1